MSTGASVRNLGFLAWRDPRAWMEEMRGPRWQARIRRERDRTEKAVEAAVAAKLPSREAGIALALSFEAAGKEDEARATWVVEAGTTRLRVTPQPGSSWSWAFDSEPAAAEPRLVGGLDLATGGYVVYTQDTGKGGERYAVTAQRRGTTLWRYKGGPEGVANEIALVGNRVYCLEAVAPLQYRRLISLDAATGGQRRVHYEETNPQMALSLWKGEGRCLFLFGEDAGRQALWWVRPDGGTVRLSPEGVCFVPAGIAPGGKEPCYLVRRGTVTAPWAACGDPLKNWALPPGLGSYGVDCVILSAGILITRAHGEREIVRVSPRGRAARPGPTVLGEIEFHPFSAWQGRMGVTQPIEIQIVTPGAARMRGWIRTGPGKGVELDIAAFEGGRGVQRLTGFTPSADGTQVRWVTVWNPAARAAAGGGGLLVTGYGAYGIPSSMSTSRWRPWLERGWTIGFALVRGGGDHTEAWAEAARVQKKVRSVEDFEACVRAIQGVSEIPPERTWIFGRSAGGYLVGAATARHPKGELFRGVYAEVPYVDVLRTASNPDLPLTKLEYNEFGNPARGPAEFHAMLALSPVDALPETGAPGVAVVCRTALEDRQVYAYEAVKWVDALRGGGKGSADAYVTVGAGQGHFTRGEGLWMERAEDLVLIQWLTQKDTNK